MKITPRHYSLCAMILMGVALCLCFVFWPTDISPKLQKMKAEEQELLDQVELLKETHRAQAAQLDTLLAKYARTSHDFETLKTRAHARKKNIPLEAGQLMPGNTSAHLDFWKQQRDSSRTR
jgi:hypothetical protein